MCNHPQAHNTSIYMQVHVYNHPTASAIIQGIIILMSGGIKHEY